MNRTPRILVGIATVTPDKRFLESIPSFQKEVERRGIADLTFHWVWDKKLVDAQNEIGDVLMAGDYTHLLTVEDDHWGFTADMLASCLEGDSDVVAISYRSRHFPFPKLPQRFTKTDHNGVRRFNSLRVTGDYEEADLCGFGFTLIKRAVLEKIGRPYFRLNNQYYKGVGPHATDIDFCYRVQQAGMKVIGCFRHIVNHRELTEEGYQEMVVNGILAKHSMFTYMQELHKKSQTNRQGVSHANV